MKLILTNPKTEQFKSNLFFSEILAIIIVVLWIGISAYTAFSNHEPDEEMNALLTPIDPTIDINVLKQYQESRIIPPQEFEIKVVTKDKLETESYTLNPFTNTTREVNSAPAEGTPAAKPTVE